MSSFHRLMSRKDKNGTGTLSKKVMSHQSESNSVSSSGNSSPPLPARPSFTRSSSISSLSIAFSSVSKRSSASLEAIVSHGTVESSTANSSDSWLLQPKQTSGLPAGLPPEEEKKTPENDDKKVKSIALRLSQLGITKYKDSEIAYALKAPYADGNADKAFNLIVLLHESEAGIIKAFDPNVKLLGAVNRDGVTCYLDALLFAMFARLGCFEAMLYTDFKDEKKKRLATLLRLWTNTLRLGKLITTDITSHIQLQLAECGWEEAAQVRQQDASEAFSFITETLALPLLTLKMDIFHHGKEEAGDDHKFVNERILEVAIPESTDDRQVIALEDCLETYFNNRIEVKRYLERRKTVGSVKSITSLDSSKGFVSHVETVECEESQPSTPLSPAPPSMKSSRRLTSQRPRAPSIIQESYISEKGDYLEPDDYASMYGGRPRAGSLRKEVMMPAWQFFSLIPWYTDFKVGNDAEIREHFSRTRPILGICLKRYSFFPNGEARRRGTHIDIPLEIGLPHFIQEDTMSADGSPFGNFKLSLQSAVCHRGTTVDSGHYVGLVRCPEPSHPTQDKWMRLDDLAKERVIDVDVEQFLLDESPYLLFYQVQPIEGDPGNIAGGEPSLETDEPPAYSEHWSSESLVEMDEKGPLSLQAEQYARNTDFTNGEMHTAPGVSASQNSDRPQSTTFPDSAATTAVADAIPRLSIDGDGPGSLTASRRPSNSKSGTASAQDGIAPSLENNRFSASMSRLASRLSKDKPEIVAPTGPILGGGPSLEVREVLKTIDKGKLKKEKSANKLKDHQHLMKGRSKSDKPDRECLVM